jgi:hypothetical protein
MKPPLTNLEGARIVRATHTTGQDSLRLEFERDILLIVYNDVRLDSVRCSIVDPPCEFTTLRGMRVEAISSSDQELSFRLSPGAQICIALDDSACQGPEAFQLIMPGYPIIVEQNT